MMFFGAEMMWGWGGGGRCSRSLLIANKHDALRSRIDVVNDVVFHLCMMLFLVGK